MHIDLQVNLHCMLKCCNRMRAWPQIVSALSSLSGYMQCTTRPPAWLTFQKRASLCFESIARLVDSRLHNCIFVCVSAIVWMCCCCAPLRRLGCPTGWGHCWVTDGFCPVCVPVGGSLCHKHPHSSTLWMPQYLRYADLYFVSLNTVCTILSKKQTENNFNQ